MCQVCFHKLMQYYKSNKVFLILPHRCYLIGQYMSHGQIQPMKNIVIKKTSTSMHLLIYALHHSSFIFNKDDLIS